MKKRSKFTVVTMGVLCFVPSVQNNLSQIGGANVVGLIGLFLLIRFSRIKI